MISKSSTQRVERLSSMVHEVRIDLQKLYMFATLLFGMAFVNSPCLAESPAEIYQRRIIPLLKSSDANSCSECHLQGIDLKQFLFEDPLRTFAELRARGWIDIDAPKKSKLLDFIGRHSEDSSELQRKVRETEFNALRMWIEAAVKDSTLLETPLAKIDDLTIDAALVRHARSDQIDERFISTIWSQLERCANCHSPDRNQKQVEKNGEQMSWIVPKSPNKTLQLLVERKLINIESPEKSLLLTKAIGEESHGGGIKFPSGGQTDRSWSRFLEDYSKTFLGAYQSSTELPNQPWIRSWRSGLHLRIAGFPSDWAGRFLVLKFYRQKSDGLYFEAPSAIAESRVSSESLRWGNSLSLLDDPSVGIVDPKVPISIPEALPDGTYQARIWLVEDAEKNGETAEPTKIIGVIELNAPWIPGHSSVKELLYTSIEARNE